MSDGGGTRSYDTAVSDAIRSSDMSALSSIMMMFLGISLNW